MHTSGECGVFKRKLLDEHADSGHCVGSLDERMPELIVGLAGFGVRQPLEELHRPVQGPCCDFNSGFPGGFQCVSTCQPDTELSLSSDFTVL